MRRFLPWVALGALLLGLAASSQDETPPPGAAREAAAAPGERTPAQRAREFRTQLLAGVELSADQIRRIDEIERQYVKEQTERLAEMDALRDEMRRARREGDGERVLEYANKLREARKGGGSHIDWIHEVRLILDLQQQKQFDANRERIRQESWKRTP